MNLQKSGHLSKVRRAAGRRRLDAINKTEDSKLFLSATLDAKAADDAESEKRTGVGLWCCKQLLAGLTKAQVED